METTTKAPTAAQLRVNHERTVKAVAKLNDKAWAGARYTALIEEGQPGVIIRESRPYNSRYDAPYTEDLRYTTKIDAPIGHPITYANKYNASNVGSICYGIDRAVESRRNKIESFHSMERGVADLKAQIEATQARLVEAEAALAARKAELGL